MTLVNLFDWRFYQQQKQRIGSLHYQEYGLEYSVMFNKYKYQESICENVDFTNFTFISKMYIFLHNDLNGT